MNQRFRCHILHAATLSAFVVGWSLWTGATATAAPETAQPPRIEHLATRNVPLNQQEQALLVEYTRHWLNSMAGGEPDDVATAGRRLRDPLNQIGVTAIFRDEYSRAAIPQVEQLLNDESLSNFAAVNIMQVVSMFGTEQAMRLMVNRSDSETEQRKSVRIWAAQGFQTLAESGHIRERQLTSFLRDFVRAAEQETDWHVLLRQFEAINAVPGSMSQQLSVLSTAVNRIERNDKANPAMQAVQRGTSLLLHRFIELSVSEQREFGMSAGPVVARVFQVADKHWDVAHASPESKVWYNRAVSSAETLLRAIDAPVRSTTPPRTTLDEAWERGNREQFKSDMQQWLRVVDRAPYKP